jgi:glycosyltransferase involved in cell wall biosynthesis
MVPEPRVLLVVNAWVGREPASGPRKDYALIGRELRASILDHAAVQQSRPGRLIARVAGRHIAQAWLAFRARRGFDVILTDGEQSGLPLALLLKLAGCRMGHVMIGHRISAGKKRPLFRWLRVHTHIDRIVLHARRQLELATTDLRIPAAQLSLVPYQVDPEFWRERSDTEERLVCSAGLELRDYPTLIQAVEGLDVEVVIAAASRWSKRANSADGAVLPANVSVQQFDYEGLRDLYARSSVVVVPLAETDFQAGVTTILEAMSMGKPVVVTHTWGQTDVVEDRRCATRGRSPRQRPPSLLRSFAEVAGVHLEQTGLYVMPGDPDALRRAIGYLLDHPAERRRLGAAGRRTVERLTTVDQFAERMRRIVAEVARA